jgi:hypothetical protein
MAGTKPEHGHVVVAENAEKVSALTRRQVQAIVLTTFARR